MKLATLKSGRRDGQLVVVSTDLDWCVPVPEIAETLQQALDYWHRVKGDLDGVSRQLNLGLVEQALPFGRRQAHSPLPRAYHWADGSAYVNHVELVRKARGAQMPESFWTDPLIYQGGSDSFIAPTDPILMASEDLGIDFESEIAVVTDDVPMGVELDQAESHIQLLMLVNDVSLRNLIPGELAKGFGFYQSKPSSAFSPVAVTPDELGACWHEARVHLPLRSWLNGELVGEPDAGTDMTFSFAQLIAHAARTRVLGAGTIIGSGTVSNYDRSRGSSCLVEKRMLETLEQGQPSTPFLQFDDRVRIEMTDDDGLSIFGAIEQVVQHYPGRH